MTRTYRFLAEASVLTLVKKTKTKPWGMAGGKEGENGYVVLWPGTEKERVTGMVYERMEPGDALINNSGGGGGWGDPLKRDPARVLEDVRNEYVSLERARTDYGVVIDPETMTVDEEATAALREELAGAVLSPLKKDPAFSGGADGAKTCLVNRMAIGRQGLEEPPRYCEEARR